MTLKPKPCGVCFDPDRRTLRFYLTVLVPRSPAIPRGTTHGAGAAWLCEPCWKRLTAGSVHRRRKLTTVVTADPVEQVMSARGWHI